MSKVELIFDWHCGPKGEGWELDRVKENGIEEETNILCTKYLKVLNPIITKLGDTYNNKTLFEQNNKKIMAMFDERLPYSGEGITEKISRFDFLIEDYEDEAAYDKWLDERDDTPGLKIILAEIKKELIALNDGVEYTVSIISDYAEHFSL